MVATYIYSGLRRAEALWLTLDDVKLSGSPPLIHVRAKEIDGEFWEPKTKVNRVVPISTALHAILSEYAGATWRGGEWFFPSPKGCRWDGDNFCHAFTKVQRRLRRPEFPVVFLGADSDGPRVQVDVALPEPEACLAAEAGEDKRGDHRLDLGVSLERIEQGDDLVVVQIDDLGLRNLPAAETARGIGVLGVFGDEGEALDRVIEKGDERLAVAVVRRRAPGAGRALGGETLDVASDGGRRELLELCDTSQPEEALEPVLLVAPGLLGADALEVLEILDEKYFKKCSGRRLKSSFVELHLVLAELHLRDLLASSVKAFPVLFSVQRVADPEGPPALED